MLYRRIVAVLSCSLAILSSASVCAADKKTDPAWLLSKYDANGDRVISVNEVEEKRKQVFLRMDGDQDGGVSFREYELLDSDKRLPILKARFDKLDYDQDGQLSGEEYASYLGSFDRLDQNRDGHVTHSEMHRKTLNRNVSTLKPEADLCVLWVCVRKSVN